MDHIKIIRQRDCLKRDTYIKEGNEIFLQLTQPGLEVMRYFFEQELAGNFIPPDDTDTIEIYIILSGRMTIAEGNETTQSIEPGEMMVVNSGFHVTRFWIHAGTELIYLSTRSNFQKMHNALDVTTNLMNQVQQYDGYTRQHCQRVKKFSLEIARILDYPSDQILDLSMAANLHDVGKLSVPKEILTKAGRLTTPEYEIIKTHSTGTRDILSPIVGENVAFIASCHHERPDGKGYPYRLLGPEIPLGSKIIAVADAYDAMLSQRSYNQVLSRTEAVVELNRFAGTQFDSDCVNALCSYLRTATKKA